MCLLSDDVIHFFTRNKNAPPPRAPTPNSRPRPFTTPPHAFLNIGMFSDLARYVWSQPFKHFELIYGFYGSFYTINIRMNIAKITSDHFCNSSFSISFAGSVLFSRKCSLSPGFSSKLKPCDFSVKGVIFKTHLHPVDLFQMFHKF